MTMRQHGRKSYTHHTQETRCETTEIENSRRGRIGEVIGRGTARCEKIGERSEDECEDDEEGKVLVEERARQDYEEESESEDLGGVRGWEAGANNEGGGTYEGEGNYCF